MNNFIDIIKIFANIDNKTKNKIAAFSQIKLYKKGEHLFLDRDNVNTLFFIVDGIAALYKIGPSLDKKVIFIHGKGDFLNEVIIQKPVASLNCELLCNSKILEINVSEFENLMKEDFTLCKNTLNGMAYRIRRMFHQLKNTSNSVRLDKQIASKLWKFSRDFGKNTPNGIEIGFKLSISYLADIVGSKRETVSRQLKVLSEENLILVKRNRIIVKDKDKLLNYFKKT
ncbi:Global nitrogen regulator [Fusobacterium sp. DD29]|uniref:Crp/Fnr family transcriptional regulator n=1 Tax=unclassified Fusobacterium TaxID=2648384 RepID=UPI001B8D88C2|nr:MULTISPECIES: Crp/Fnr family transcriptional regulator [unclassified Fusobacterium]MBR8700854.1 Global nitrogen regulator [Fusobacterium sp. DD45]MBR8710607.1 Global nitrogen regulator [Fusobacterium sp. DD28]MBR8748651.1 Global nitrogen regulator [Fusobacterium sp. DD29]MBR8751204.1 Global nitrogen regulator [Fusobacterium sp. DD26]MBR8760885.1 Global nitrogen regulator [Fusobacterium sp. DD25]